MDKKELWKKVVIGTAVLGACVGTVWGAASYWTGNSFQPGQSSRAFRNNQVLFDEERSSQAQGDDSGKDSFWEDERSGDKVSGSQQEPGYLFSPEENIPNSAGIVGSDADNTASGDGSGLPDTVIDITDRSSGDTGTVVNPGGESTGGSTIGGSGENTDPTAPTSPITGDGTVSNPYQGGVVIEDPGTDKELPSGVFDDQIHITDQITIPANKDPNVFIISSFSASASPLYKGQVIDAKTIFAALDTYVVTSDYTAYYWDVTDIGKLIRFDRISFDNTTWFDLNNTITIPTEADTLYIQVSYRFRTTDNWISYDKNPVTYPLQGSRVLLLNTTVKDENKIPQSQLVNFDPMNQRFSVGQKANLLYYQERLIRSREKLGSTIGSVILAHLFPGWQENGEFVLPRYSVTPGRHVLQAPQSVSYDTKNYQIELRRYYLDEDYSINNSISASDTLSYLQTLTHYKGKTTTLEDGTAYLPTLTVPEYTQAVDFPYTPPLTVDTLAIPKATVYVNTDGIQVDALSYSCGLRVSKAYTVEAGNPRYTARDGILYNQDGTQILGVPVDLTELTIPEGITLVHLPWGSQLKTLTLQAKNGSALPEINYACLPKDCVLLVDESVLESLLRTHADALRDAQLYVSAIQAPEKAYRVRENLILERGGSLHSVLETDARWLSTAKDMTGMEPGCLQGLNQLTMIHLPTGGDALDLPQGCFGGAPKLEMVVCYSAAQYEAAKAVAPEGVQVLLAGAIESGSYRYLEMDGGQIMLLQVPENLTEFNGQIPTAEGGTITVNAISNDVFSPCADLQWVDLPKETTAIGQAAFRNCRSLQGVVIGADTAMIGKNAFDGCVNLRFIASNAVQMDLRCPELSLPCQVAKDYSYLFCLSGAQGYNPNWISFVESDQITGFRLVDCGGTKVLYGVTGDNLWLALRAGSVITGPVTLPPETEVIYTACFQGSASQVFDLNWQALTELRVLHPYCFSGSGLGPDVTLPADLVINTHAFSNCASLRHIVLPSAQGDLRLSGEIFTGCASLESAVIGQLSYFSAIPFGIFNDCGNLTQLTFQGNPARLSLYENGFQFRFDYSQWNDDTQEEAHLRITVPEGMEESYLEKWRYAFTGYMGSTYQSDYQALWNAVVQNSKKELTDEQIRRKVESMLLEAENHLRVMMGLDKKDAPLHRFQYTVDKDGAVMLTGAKDVDYIELTAANLDMPEGWYVDYISTNAFRESPDLRMLLLPDDLSGFYNGAFSGVTASADDALCVALGGTVVPDLLGFAEGVPFSFGVDDDCIEIMDFNGDLGTEEILKKWMLPMAGYQRLQDLVNSIYFSQGKTATKDSVTNEVMQRLFTAENRLRTILQLEPIQAPEELTGISQEEITRAISRLPLLSMSAALDGAEDAEESSETEALQPSDPENTELTEETKPEETEPEETEPEETAPEETTEATTPTELEPTETTAPEVSTEPT